jgi:proteasome lid subunit RPN8/RPN11
MLTPDAAAEILAHARQGYPDEVCGLVAGPPGRGTGVCRGQNVSPTPRVAFELDTDTLALQLEFEAQGLSLAAIYHSHPHGPDAPSSSDIAQAYYPDVVYLICSLAQPEKPVLRAFRIVEGSAWEVRLLHTFDT